MTSIFLFKSITLLLLIWTCSVYFQTVMNSFTNFCISHFWQENHINKIQPSLCIIYNQYNINNLTHLFYSPILKWIKQSRLSFVISSLSNDNFIMHVPDMLSELLCNCCSCSCLIIYKLVQLLSLLSLQMLSFSWKPGVHMHPISCSWRFFILRLQITLTTVFHIIVSPLSLILMHNTLASLWFFTFINFQSP